MFGSEANKYESRFGKKTRDKERTLAVNKLIAESLLNCRFGHTTMYDELINAREEIILVNVMTATILKPRKTDTSSPADVGMAAEDDHDETEEHEEQRITDIAVQAVYKGVGHMGSWGRGQSLLSAPSSGTSSEVSHVGFNRVPKNTMSPG